MYEVADQLATARFLLTTVCSAHAMQIALHCIALHLVACIALRCNHQTEQPCFRLVLHHMCAQPKPTRHRMIQPAAMPW